MAKTKKDKGTNNDVHNITHKTKDLVTRIYTLWILQRLTC